MVVGGENFEDAGPKNIGQSNPQQAEGLTSAGVIPPPGNMPDTTEARLQKTALFTEDAPPTTLFDWTTYADNTANEMKQLLGQNDAKGALSRMDSTVGRAYLLGNQSFGNELFKQMQANGVWADPSGIPSFD